MAPDSCHLRLRTGMYPPQEARVNKACRQSHALRLARLLDSNRSRALGTDADLGVHPQVTIIIMKVHAGS